ncbi:NADP-dependent oxidoreductase [Nocardioides terrisoli]|uniref:NADP-dependent oxidoreductase n=1 Tax=Nocardioides terrisoli TaxID=3388267 RepID=UPI00287B9661|nr:NADP-dependent oxidoreductase [Nocardioides marmorisolisilvae]
MTKIVVATAYGGPDVLSVVDVERPEPGPDEVRVAVRAAGVNPADLKARAGLFGDDPAHLPRRLGSEAAGVVTGVGPTISSPRVSGPHGPVAVGDEVIAYRAAGAYADEIVVPASSIVAKPQELGWAEAGGLLLTGATAVHLLTATDVAAGDTVLVHGGSGGVGLMLVQLARLRGARVVATAGPGNHDRLRDLGAEPVAYGAGLVDRVRTVAPDGVDVALDLVGTDEAMDVSLALVADRRRIATIANFARGPREGVAVLGGGPGADPGTEIRDAARSKLAQLAGDGLLRVFVAATFPLDRVADAHRMAAGAHPGGKILLVP